MIVRLIVALLLLFFPGLLFSQNKNIILRLVGDAEIMYRGMDQWMPLSEKDTVSLLDVINLSSGSSVSIMKTSTRAVYKSECVGPIMVYDIFKSADAGNMAVIKRVISEATLGNRVESKPDYSSYGASVRGQRDGAVTASVYAGLFDAVTNFFLGHEAILKNHSLDLCRIDNGDLIAFQVINHSDSVYYVNLVCLDPSTSSFNLCYSFDSAIEIAPKTELTLPARYCNMEGIKYMLLASTEEYNSSLLDINIRNCITPECAGGENCLFVLE